MRRAAPLFMVVLNQSEAKRTLPEVAKAAISGGVDLVQVREKLLERDALRRLAESVVEAVGGPDLVSINSDIALAMELSTSLHLPEAVDGDWTSIKLAPSVILGRSIHSADCLWSTDQVDYLALGNLFKTGSKRGSPGLGLEAFAAIVEQLPIGLPVMAIGGIRPETVEPAFAAGASGVAVSSYVNSAADPEQAAREVRRQIDAWMT